MWYESSDLLIFTLSVLFTVWFMVKSWIKTYTENKYGKKSNFKFEVEMEDKKNK